MCHQRLRLPPSWVIGAYACRQVAPAAETVARLQLAVFGLKRSFFEDHDPLFMIMASPNLSYTFVPHFCPTLLSHTLVRRYYPIWLQSNLSVCGRTSRPYAHQPAPKQARRALAPPPPLCLRCRRRQTCTHTNGYVTVISVALCGGARTVSIPKSGKSDVGFSRSGFL